MGVVGAGVFGPSVGARVSPVAVGRDVTGATVGANVARRLGATEGVEVMGLREAMGSVPSPPLSRSMILRLCRANKALTTMVVTAKTRMVKSSKASFPW